MKTSSPSAGWSVVLPVKGAGGKSRLLRDLALAGAGFRLDAGVLSAAMAADVLASVLGAASVDLVVVVSRDDAVLSALQETVGPGEAGVITLRDLPGPLRRPLPDGEEPSLNRAVLAGLARAGDHGAHRAAVVVPDLVCLRPNDLETTLARAASLGGPVVVPDANGTGTSLLAGPLPLAPRFGRGSLARHRDDGAIALDDVSARLRRDVDTLNDLAAARSLGLGERTGSLLAGAG